MSDPTKIVKGIITICIGVAMIPILGAFLAVAKADANVTAIVGAELFLDVIPYGVFAVLTFLGFGMIKEGK